MAILQLNPAIPVLTPNGPAIAVMVETDDWDVFWCTFLKENGECWWWRNHYIRLAPSITAERVNVSEIHVPEDLKNAVRTARAKQKIKEKE